MRRSSRSQRLGCYLLAELERRGKRRSCRRICEVGVETGGSVAPLIEAIQPEVSLLVDHWEPYSTSTDQIDRHGDRRRSLARMRSVAARLGYLPGIIIAKAESRIIGELLREGTFDLVFIDGGHTYAVVKSDLKLYWPCVRPGGTFAGHDYSYLQNRRRGHGVKQAVDEFVAEQGLTMSELEKRIWWIDKPRDYIS